MVRRAYGDVGELLAGLFVGVDCDVVACVLSFRVGAYSLNDFCFLLVALPARWLKLSRYDLFLLVVNIVLVCLAWVEMLRGVSTAA